jgi:hypothetical protein
VHAFSIDNKLAKSYQGARTTLLRYCQWFFLNILFQCKYEYFFQHYNRDDVILSSRLTKFAKAVKAMTHRCNINVYARHSVSKL